jgi:hypothetical protein
MEQIIEEELGALNASYMERTTKEVLPSWILAMGASILNVKMERPLEDQEVNVTYWYLSWWRDIKLRWKTLTNKKLEIIII